MAKNYHSRRNILKNISKSQLRMLPEISAGLPKTTRNSELQFDLPNLSSRMQAIECSLFNPMSSKEQTKRSLSRLVDIQKSLRDHKNQKSRLG